VNFIKIISRPPISDFINSVIYASEITGIFKTFGSEMADNVERM